MAGVAIGAGAIAIAGDDEVAAPAAMRTGHGLGVGDEEADRHGDVVVFLVEDVSDGDRQAIEVALDADEDVEAYEYWNAEASQAEARRLFRDDPEMIAKFDDDFQVPTSYRLLLRDPSRPNAMIVSPRGPTGCPRGGDHGHCACVGGLNGHSPRGDGYPAVEVLGRAQGRRMRSRFRPPDDPDRRGDEFAALRGS